MPIITKLHEFLLIFSTRISNELGAGKPEGARVSVIALMLLTAIDAVVVSASLFASRNVFGYIFSNEKEVVDYVTIMAPLVCLSIIMDSIQGVLSGDQRVILFPESSSDLRKKLNRCSRTFILVYCIR